MNAIFDSFVFEGNMHSKQAIEEAIIEEMPLASDRIRLANDALLKRLNIMKKNGLTNEDKKVQEKINLEVQKIVNALVLINKGWVAKTISNQRHYRNLIERNEEYESLALVGDRPTARSGVMRAIITYDYDKCGVNAFSRYINQAIVNEFSFSQRRSKFSEQVEKFDVIGHTKSAEEILYANELKEIIFSSVKKLPPMNKMVANFIFDRIMTTGNRPNSFEIAELLKISPAQATILTRETMDMVFQEIKAHYPQTVVNNYDYFKEVFGTKRRTASL